MATILENGFITGKLESSAIFKLKLISKPAEKKSDNSGFLEFLRWFGIIALGVVTAFVAPESEGAIIPSLILSGETAGDIALNIGIDYAEKKPFNYLNVVLPVAFTAPVIFGIFKSALKIKAINNAVDEIKNTNLNGLNEFQKNTVISQVAAAGNGIAADNIKIVLERAGLTSESQINNLRKIEQVLKKSGEPIKRFSQQLDFINQETEIFGRVSNDFEKQGIKLDEVFEALRNGGIDVIGIQTRKDLAKAIRKSPQIIKALKNSTYLSNWEKAIGETLSPSFAAQLFNANRIYKIAHTADRHLRLLSPTRLVNKIVKKSLHPVEKYMDEKIWSKISKPVTQKIKQLLRQDMADRAIHANGVYPCLASGWINYLRAISFGNGNFQAFVIFRKRGHQPVLITPLLDLDFIISWSKSLSPGRIYHEFRQQYGGPKSVKISALDVSPQSWMYFGIVSAFAPKYLNLGFSLATNILNAITQVKAARSGHWFGEAFYKQALQTIEGESLQAVSGGGHWAEAILNQVQGDNSALTNYTKGKIGRITRRHSSEAQKEKRKAKRTASVASRGNRIIERIDKML